MGKKFNKKKFFNSFLAFVWLPRNEGEKIDNSIEVHLTPTLKKNQNNIYEEAISLFFKFNNSLSLSLSLSLSTHTHTHTHTHY